jgi:hypothetical protein
MPPTISPSFLKSSFLPRLLSVRFIRWGCSRSKCRFSRLN